MRRPNLRLLLHRVSGDLVKARLELGRVGGDFVKARLVFSSIGGRLVQLCVVCPKSWSQSVSLAAAIMQLLGYIGRRLQCRVRTASIPD